MFALLLETILHLLFAPIAIGALLGILYAFLFRKKNVLFWIVTASILFMIGWRYACMSVVIVSTRYFSILLYPALVLTSYFLFQMEPIYFRLMTFYSKKKSTCNKKCQFIPWLFLLGIACASIIKVFHFNPNSAGIINACQAFMANRKGKEIVRTYEVNGTEHNRIRYYTDINNYLEPASLLIEQYVDVENEWDNIIRDNRNIFGTHYFFNFQKTDKTDYYPTEEILAGGDWYKVCRCSISRNNKKEVVLYGYSPDCKHFELWEKPIPEMSPDNLCQNGNFEQYLIGKELEQRFTYYKDIEASDFYLAPNRLFPRIWWLGVSKYIDGDSPEIALTADAPISGNYSLEINGKGIGVCGTNSGFIKKQDCVFTGFVRGIDRSEVFVYSCYWDNDKKKTSYIEKNTYLIEPEKTYRFTIEVSEKDVPEKDESIYIIVQSPGHILLDNVEFIHQRKPESLIDD